MITATFGAVSLSRPVKPRPARIGISIVSKKLDDTTSRLIESCRPGGYVRPDTKMLVELTLADSNGRFESAADRTPATVRKRSRIIWYSAIVRASS